jgi:hypothetical protein
VGKEAGDEHVFIAGRGSGCQMKPAQDAISNAAGGEGGHGAAKPDGVIHNLMQKDQTLLIPSFGFWR